MSLAAAGAYLVTRSVVNWVRLRLRRLRQPRYLLASLGMLLWLGSMAINAGIRRRPLPASAFPFEGLGVGLEAIAAALATFVLLLSWILGKPRRAYGFTEADVQHLFTAPVARRPLLLFAILRPVLLAVAPTLGVSLIVGAMSGAAVLRLVPVFLVIGTAAILNGFAAGGTRAWLRERVPSRWRLLRWAGGAVLALALLAAPFAPGPLHWLAWPALALTAPFFATGAGPTTAALASAALVPAVFLAMAVGMAGAFEEDAVLGAEQQARQLALYRAGGLAALRLQRGGRRPARRLFRLAPAGRPELALTWRAFTELEGNWRVVPILLPVVVLLSWLLEWLLTSGGRELPVPLAALLAGLGLVVTLLSGPHLGLGGLGLELRRLDLLKALPIPGHRIVLGLALAPMLLLAALWIALGSVLAAAAPGLTGLERSSAAVALIVAGPAYLSLAVVLQAGLVAWLPDWFTIGRPGQASGGSFLSFLLTVLGAPLAALPGALAALVVWLVGRPLAGWGALPVAAMAFAAVLAVEVALLLRVVGWQLERLDPAEP